MLECPLELAVQSEYSPSTVADDEAVAYALISPDQYDQTTGRLKPLAFSKSKLMKGEVSVFRTVYTTEVEVTDRVICPQLERDRTREYCGCWVASALQIRSLQDAGIRQVCIVDDGLVDFSAHVHLSFSEAVQSSTKNVKEAVRANLIETFSANGGPYQLGEIC